MTRRENMQREISGWFSPALQKHMPLAAYGHYGFALLMIPTAAADYLEYERFQLIDSLRPMIDGGRMKLFSIDSINNESWMNAEMEPAHKAIRHNQFNEYVFQEVIPFIRNHCSPHTPIITCGASFGALHAMNLFLKRPDLLQGTISMSGVYDLTDYTRGFFDEQVYFNSPQHYIPNLNDHGILERQRNGRIIIATGSGNHEDPDANRRFSEVLNSKSIPHTLDIWGSDIHHDWPTWRQMLPHLIQTHF